MEEYHGLTAGLYQAVVAIVDDRVRDMRATREGFDRLTEGIAQLAQAQARTEEQLGQLAGRMDELAGRVDQLSGRMDRVEEALMQLAQAQLRTEGELQRTQQTLRQLTRQVGGLSGTVGGDIEDIAYIVLHDVLGREFGWRVGVLERTWQRWDGGQEINVFGRATDPTRPDQIIWIVGEAKHNLTLREVRRFARQVEQARRHLIGEVFAVCFAYRARPEVRARLKELGIPLVFSYGRFA